MKHYNNIKTFFKYILEKEYLIIKDPNSTEIIKITYDNNEVKCKYVLLFSIENNEQINKLIWSYDNPYIDQKTKIISLLVKNRIEQKKKYNWDNFNQKELLNIINIIIKENLQINLEVEGEIINPSWIITGNIKNIIQYYMIIDIIYY